MLCYAMLCYAILRYAMLCYVMLRFGVVKSECRRAAMVPKEVGSGLFGHMLATMLASVTFAPKGMVEGDGPEEVLARADYLLEVFYILIIFILMLQML